jgi:hypothetical protein
MCLLLKNRPPPKMIGVGIEWYLVKGSGRDPERVQQQSPGLRPLRDLHPGLCCVALSALGSLALMRTPSGA